MNFNEKTTFINIADMLYYRYSVSGVPDYEKTIDALHYLSLRFKSFDYLLVTIFKVYFWFH